MEFGLPMRIFRVFSGIFWNCIRDRRPCYAEFTPKVNSKKPTQVAMTSLSSDDFLIRETHIDMAAVVHKPDLSPLEKRIRDLEEAVGKSHQGGKDAESVRKWGLL